MTVSTIHLGKVVDVSAGQPAPKPSDFSEDGYPFIRAGSLEGLLSGLTEDDCEKIDAETARRYRMRLYPKDTILFAKSGMSAKIGRVYRMRQPAYVVSHLAALAPIGKYEPSYLAHWLRAHPPSKLIKDDAYPSIRTSEVSSLEVPDLHIDEQRRIAAILDKADALRRKREQAIAMADEFLKSAFLKMFGDPLDNPYGFSRERIGDRLSKTRAGTQSGPFGSALKKHEYTDYGVPVWGVENVHPNRFKGEARLFISNEKFEDLRRYNVVRGDVLISRAGTVGRMCVAEPGCAHSIISTNLVRVSLDQSKLLPEYFVCLFTYFADRLSALKANNKDDAFTFLNPKTLREIKIPIPEIARQQNFVRMTRKLDGLLARAQDQRDGLSDLFSSLSQRAFRGEL
jgi:type I restriction enzyme S subunit